MATADAEKPKEAAAEAPAVEPAKDTTEEASKEAPTKEAPAVEPAKDEAAKSSPAKKATPSEPSKEQPAAKRLKPTPAEPATVRKQIEYYLSDENLKYDKFFSEKMSADKDGWLDVNLILSCNKMKAMAATKEDVMAALKDSKIEIREDGLALRRPGNAPLPKLEQRPVHAKKSSIHAHDGGVIACLSGIPEEQSWMQMKEKLKEKLPPKVQLWFVSEVNDKHQCVVATSPFEGDKEFFEELQIEAGGIKLKSEVCYNDLLHSSVKLLPKHIREKRERESRKRQKERNRPIVVGTQKFINVAALRGRIKEIMNSRSDGEQLKTEGTDFKLVKALLGYHPKGDAKSKGLVGIRVGKSTQGDSRCFYMIKEDETEEDFSVQKCLNAIEQDPPYVKAEPKAEPAKKDKEKKDDKKEEKTEDKKEESAQSGGEPPEKKARVEPAAAEASKPASEAAEPKAAEASKSASEAAEPKAVEAAKPAPEAAESKAVETATPAPESAEPKAAEATAEPKAA
jgi:hypothetical protein